MVGVRHVCMSVAFPVGSPTCCKEMVHLLFESCCFPVCIGNISPTQKKEKKWVFEETRGTRGSPEGRTNESLVVKASHWLKHNKQKSKCRMKDEK